VTDLTFYKLSPRVDNRHGARWLPPLVHASAVWAAVQFPALHIYAINVGGCDMPAPGLRWQASLSLSGWSTIPDWVKTLIEQGQEDWGDPDTIRLLPGRSFSSMQGIKAALQQAIEEDEPNPDAVLAELLL